MYREMKRHAQALLLGTLLSACGATSEQGSVSTPEAPDIFGRVRAPVTSASSESLSTDLLGDIGRVFGTENRLPVTGDVDFIDNQDPNLLVQQNNSEVFVTYVKTIAELNSTLAYFTYPDGSPPTTPPTLTQANVVFAQSQGLTAGTRVSLGVFNAGTRIGLVLLPGAGTSNPPSLAGTRYYSVNSLNGGSSYFISKYHKAEQRRIIGIEDRPAGSGYYDLNDLLVSVSSTPREKPRNVTVCSHTFPNLSLGGWQHRDWVPSDCSAGLPPSNAIALGSGTTSNGIPRQQVHCTPQRGSHYYLSSGLTHGGTSYGPHAAYGTVTCAYVIPEEMADIRTCSYFWPAAASGIRVRGWQASDCPQGLPDTSFTGIGHPQNDAGSGGHANCSIQSEGHHYNHPFVDGATSGRVSCLYVKPSRNTDNLTICSKAWDDVVTGWRTHTWTAADCSNGLPKPGAVAIAQTQNGNGTRGIGQCGTPSATQAAYGGQYNHPEVVGGTSGKVMCLYVSP
ncbi:MAG TPA: hypothetical protein VEU33_28020 [Archangium sp.]|nr:hypothetical protein [Archangium sp.]